MLVAPFRHPLASLTLQRFALSLAAVVAVVLHTGVGAASTHFPKEVRDTLQLDCTPTCLLCHKTLEGGADNLNFYGTQNRAGIRAGIPEFYAPDGEASKRNTDMDDKGSDRDEIIANSDPGTSEDVGICSDAVYGCGAAQVAPGGTPRTSWWALAAALGVALFLLRKVRA